MKRHLIRLAGLALFASGIAQAIPNSTVIYRCQLFGVRHTTTGYLVVAPEDLAAGGSSLELSDSTGIGDTAGEFCSANLFAYSASRGKILISALLSSHDPGAITGGMTALRVAKAVQEFPLGEPKFELNFTGPAGEVALVCGQVTL